MSDSYSYDIDITDPNDLEDPIDRMIRDLVDYKLNVCSVQELLAMAAAHMSQDLENRPLTEIQEIHDGLFARNKEMH
ncbi:MAG: hypothetical protein ACYSUV_20765 [Planctomycetota bacterium]